MLIARGLFPTCESFMLDLTQSLLLPLSRLPTSTVSRALKSEAAGRGSGGNISAFSAPHRQGDKRTLSFKVFNLLADGVPVSDCLQSTPVLHTATPGNHVSRKSFPSCTLQNTRAAHRQTQRHSEISPRFPSAVFRMPRKPPCAENELP